MDEQTNQPSQPTPPNQLIHDSSKTELYGRIRLGLLLLGIIGITIFGRFCGQKKIEDNIPGQAIEIKHPPSTVTIRQSNSSNGSKSIHTVTRYVPPEGNLTITPKDPTKSIDDLVKIHYQELGWTFEPGLEFSGNYYWTYGMDAKLFYAYRFGFGAGLVTGSNVTTIISPDVFLSYRLDQIHLRNTEAIVTYTPASKIPFGLGLRINL